MTNYKKLYFQLFNAVTDAIDGLKQAQIDAEDAYIEDGENDEIDASKIKKFKVHTTDNEEEKE